MSGMDLAEVVSNASNGKLYGVSTRRNPFIGAWETAVIERPGVLNWITRRRRLIWRLILVTSQIVGEKVGAAGLALVKSQPIAFVHVESSPSDEDARSLHSLVVRVVGGHPENEWGDLFFERIESDLAHLDPDILADLALERAGMVPRPPRWRR